MSHRVRVEFRDALADGRKTRLVRLTSHRMYYKVGADQGKGTVAARRHSVVVERLGGVRAALAIADNGVRGIHSQLLTMSDATCSCRFYGY